MQLSVVMELFWDVIFSMPGSPKGMVLHHQWAYDSPACDSPGVLGKSADSSIPPCKILIHWVWVEAQESAFETSA